MKKTLIILLLISIAGCSKTRRIGLSNKEVKSLKVIYNQEFRNKFLDTKWTFYEKNICQYTIKSLSKTTYTGIWIENNDTITANFFYKKIASERKLTIDKSNNELNEILK